MKYFIVFVLLLTGCFESSAGQKELNQIKNLVKNRLYNDFGLIFVGSGICWPDKCKALEYDFTYTSVVTIPEARYLVVNAIRAVLESAKEVDEFEQYLETAPFTEKNIIMGISFALPKASHIENSYIEFVIVMRGKISYNNFNNFTYRYDTVLEETYEEALEMLKKENEDLY